MGFLDFLNPFNLGMKSGLNQVKKTYKDDSAKFVSDIKSAPMQVPRRLAQGVEDIPAGMGGGLEVLGAAMPYIEKIPFKPIVQGAFNLLNPAMASTANPILSKTLPDMDVRLPSIAQKALKVTGPQLKIFGQTAKDFWQKASSTGWEAEDQRTFEEAPISNVIGGAARSTPLMLMSMAITERTGSSTAGALAFAPQAMSSAYDRLIKAGVGEKDAVKGAIADAAQQVVLENWVLSTWIGNRASGMNRAMRSVMQALAEGPAEEGFQGVGSNAIDEALIHAKKNGYNIIEEAKSGRLWDRLSKDVLPQILSGSLMGGATGAIGPSAPSIAPESVVSQNRLRVRALQEKQGGRTISSPAGPITQLGTPLTQQEKQELKDLQKVNKRTVARPTAPWVQAAVDKAMGKDVRTFSVGENTEGAAASKAEEQFNQAHPIEYKKGDYPEGATDSHRKNLDLFDEFYIPNKKLKGENRVLAAKALRRVRENIDTLLLQYEDSPALKGKKNLVNTDIFRELFVDEGYNKVNSNAFHETASALSKVYLERLLQEGRVKGNKKILFLSGAAGAGKTTGLTAINNMNTDSYAAVIDGTLSGYEEGTKLAKLNKIATDGFKVSIVYTFRDPAEAWNNGVLKRIIGGSDPRAIVLKNFLNDSRNLIENITKHADNPNLKLIIVDNSRGAGQQRVITPQEFKESIQKKFNEMSKNGYWEKLQRRLINDIEELYREGKLTREYRDALLHGVEQKSQGESRAAEARQEVADATGEGVLEEVDAEQMRASRSTAKGGEIAPELQSLADEARKYKSADEFIANLEKQGKISFHGTPNDFEDFSYEFMGTQGTSEGKGFYFTNDKGIAKGYMKADDNGNLSGKLIEAYIDVKKPLSLDKKEITLAKLKKFIKAIDPDGQGYLSNWGDVSTEGYDAVLNNAVKSEYKGNDNDVDLISSIVNASGGNPESIYPILKKTLGYDGIIAKNASWGKGQTITVAFNNDQIITKKKLTDLHSKLSPKEGGGDTESLAAKKYEDVTRPTDEPSAILQGILDASMDKVEWDKTDAPFIKKNMDIYEETVDPDTECPRWKDFSQLIKDVELRMGRKVTQEEYHNLRTYAKNNGAVVPCPFCYTATHRTVGAMANIAKGQSVYKGKILAWVQAKIDRLNSHAGLRFFSNTDYKPSHTPDLIRVMWDMSVRGLKGHAYTKQINFVDIFGDTGLKINMSIGGDVKGGQLVENTDLGISWDDALERRDKYKNVGTIFVAKSEEEIWKALDAEFIDHIIPIHRSGQSLAILKKYGATKDFTAEQSEVYKATGKKYESKVPDSVHNGEKQAYLDWCEQKGLIPKFQQFVGHQNYMKLVGPEAGKFNDNTQDVVDPSKIDYGKAEEVMGKWASGEGDAYPVTALEAMTATGLTPSEQTIAQQKLFKSEADEAFGSVGILENVITRVANNAQVNGNKVGEGVYKRRKISEELRKRGYIKHVGLKLENEGDAAELASIFRHPTLERVQVIYVKDGIVLSHEVLTSGSPDCVNFNHRQQTEVKLRAAKLGADKVWIAHNHPSGNYTPSAGDISVSTYMARSGSGADPRARLGNLFAGHIVLNHKSYSTIYANQQGGYMIATDKYRGGQKPSYNVGNLKSLLRDTKANGYQIYDMAKKVATLGREFVANGTNSIIFLDGAMRVVAINNIKYGKNINAFINNKMSFYGVTEYYIITSASEEVDSLIKTSLPDGARGILLMGQGDNYWSNVSLIRSSRLKLEPNVFDKKAGGQGSSASRIQASKLTEIDVAASDVVYDKEGRRMLNLEWMNIPESEKAILRAKAEQLRPEIEKIKGETITHDEVIRAAIEAELIKTGVNREYTLEMSARLLRLRQHVAAMAKTGTVTKEFIEALSVLNAQAANVARQLNSFKIGANPVYADIKIDLIKQLIKMGVNAKEIIAASVGVDFTNQQQVTEFYRKFVKPNIQDILTEYRYINLLSSPLTHLVNTFSNIVQTLGLAPLTKAGTATVDVIYCLLPSHGRKYYYSEVPAYYRGMSKSMPEALSGFFKALKGETFIERPDIARIPTNNKYLKPFYVIPRLLEASDVFFRTLVGGGELESLMSKVKNPTSKQMSTMKEIAANKAAYYVFRGALDVKNESGQGYLLTTIDNFTSKIVYPLRRFGISYGTKSGEVRTVALGSWFIPFVQTPMNIAKQMLEYSPAGVATTWGAKNKAEQMGKALIGSLGTLVVATLVAMGNVTWAAPTDKKKKALFYATGRKPYSIKLGNNWYSFSRLGPIAIWFAIPAAIKWYMEEDPKSLTSTRMENMSKVAMSMSEFLADQTYLEGVGNFADFLRGDDTAIGRITTNIPSQLVPLSSLLRWTTNIIDPVFRETESGLSLTTIKENMMKQIPFLSKSLPAYEESTGEESRRMRINAISPITISPNNPNFEMEYQGAMADSAAKGIDSYAKTHFDKKLDAAWRKGDGAKVERLRQEAGNTMGALYDKFEKKYSKEKMQGFRSLMP